MSATSTPSPRNGRARLGRLLAIAATLVVLASLAAAIAVMGTPAQQRLIRLDERRVDDLRAILDAARRHGRPADLATLAAMPGERLATTDPDGRPYEYAPIAKERIRLCAHFATDTAQRASERWHHGSRWRHAAGRQCFERSMKAEDAAAVIEGPFSD